MDRSHEFRIYSGVKLDDSLSKSNYTDEINQAIHSTSGKIRNLVKTITDELQRHTINTDVKQLKDDVLHLKNIIASNTKRRFLRRTNQTLQCHYKCVVEIIEEILNSIEEEVRLLHDPADEYNDNPNYRFTYISDRDLTIPSISFEQPQSPIRVPLYFGPNVSLQTELKTILDGVDPEVLVQNKIKSDFVEARILQEDDREFETDQLEKTKPPDLYDALIESEIQIMQQKLVANDDRNMLQAQRKLYDINEMVTTFAKNIMEQAEDTTELQRRTEDSSKFISDSILELKKALKNADGKATFYLSCFIVMIIFVTVLDLFL